jgi:hypothetical protein
MCQSFQLTFKLLGLTRVSPCCQDCGAIYPSQSVYSVSEVKELLKEKIETLEKSCKERESRVRYFARINHSDYESELRDLKSQEDFLESLKKQLQTI